MSKLNIVTLIVVAAGAIATSTTGVFRAYLVGLVMCVAFCAVGRAGGLLEVWLDERRDRKGPRS